MTTARSAWISLAALFVVRHDLWWWNRPVEWLGGPASLWYHVGFVLLVTIGLVPLARRLGEHGGEP